MFSNMKPMMTKPRSYLSSGLKSSFSWTKGVIRIKIIKMVASLKSSTLLSKL